MTESFDRLCRAFAGRDGVEQPGEGRAFGSSALKVDRKIFAMAVAGRLVLKLPAARVRALIADGDGMPFDAGKGRPMKEWVALADDTEAITLAEEAYAFVGGRPAR